MSTPHLCPKCLGWKQVLDDRAPAATAITMVQCPVCFGAGVLWSLEPEPFKITFGGHQKCSTCGGDLVPGAWHVCGKSAQSTWTSMSAMGNSPTSRMPMEMCQ